MEKIIQQNQNEWKQKYFAVALVSIFTLRKLKTVEKCREELKKFLIEEQEQEEDPYKL